MVDTNYIFPPALYCILTGFPVLSTAFSPWLSNACPLVSACDNLLYKTAKVCKGTWYMVDLESLTSSLLRGRHYISIVFGFLMVSDLRKTSANFDLSNFKLPV